MKVLPDVVVGADFGMTSTGIAYSVGPEWTVRTAYCKIPLPYLDLGIGFRPFPLGDAFLTYQIVSDRDRKRCKTGQEIPVEASRIK